MKVYTSLFFSVCVCVCIKTGDLRLDISFFLSLAYFGMTLRILYFTKVTKKSSNTPAKKKKTHTCGLAEYYYN